MRDSQGSEAAERTIAPEQPTNVVRRFHLDALAGYFLIATACSYPMPIFARSAYVGAGDTYQFVWFNWLFARTWFQGMFTHSNMLFHPFGAELVQIDNCYYNALLAMGTYKVFGDTLGYNLIQLFNWALCGFSGYLFARYFVRDRRAAFIGGVVYGFSPYLASRFAVHPNLAAAQFIPLVALFAMRLLEHRRVRDALAAGVFLGLTGLCSWYHLFTMAIWLGLHLLYALVVSDRRLLQPRLWGVITLAGGVAGLVLMPFLLPWLTLGHVSTSGSAVAPGINAVVGDLFGAVTPGPFHPIWGDWVKPIYAFYSRYHEGYAIRPSALEQIVFVGYSALILAVIGIRRGGAPSVRFLMSMAVAFWVLTLGAFLHIAGFVFVGTDGRLLSELGLDKLLHRIGFDSEVIGIPMPYWLFGRLPGLSVARAPSRMILGTMLALAPLAAIGCASLLKRIEERRGHRWAGGLTLLLAVIIPFESTIAPYEEIDPGYSPILESLRAIPADKAVLNLPIFPVGKHVGAMVARYMYEQTVHEKPIVGGYISRNPAHAFTLISEEPLLAALRSPLDGIPDEPAWARSALYRLDIGVIVLHRNHYLPPGDPGLPFHGVPLEFYNPTVAALQTLFGPPCHEDGEVMVFAGALPCETLVDVHRASTDSE